MAIIAMFYGIIVSMYYFDNTRYKLPHIHIRYRNNSPYFVIARGDSPEAIPNAA
ncbi:MAG: hypothetical protein HUU23_05825 [Caldilineales bacterium]|nr:hypothetical protein [Caldilineales bacterium]